MDEYLEAKSYIVQVIYKLGCLGSSNVGSKDVEDSKEMVVACRTNSLESR